MPEAAGRSGAWRWGPPAVALLLAIAVALSGGNVALFHWFNSGSVWSGDALWADFTVLGDTVFVFALLLPWAPRRPDIVFAAFIAAVPATLWVDVLKPLIDSPRPAAVLPLSTLHIIGPELTARSFPSGHTTAIFTLAGVIALSLARSRWRWLLLAAAALVGVSRCAVGAHWPLDVLAGAFGGWLSAWAGVALARRWHAVGARPRVRATLMVLCLVACLSLFGFDGGYALAQWWARGLAMGLLLFFVVELLRRD
ncbi:MAG: phosphatase PAP2 family protein [Acidihalobacter sp.]|uniref:phosphatase PAP2 family protein n=1 Tax=Acidihalobacter sp. TaxID=1872108 RepID=UPI00307CD8D1